MLRKDLPIRNDLMDGTTVIQKNNVANAQTFLSPIRSGLSSELTITVPDPLIPVPWTPAYIDTDIWLDASVIDSVILSSGSVQQWLDLSGENNHFTQSTPASMPGYTSGEYVSFDGIDDFLTRALPTGLSANSQKSFFACFTTESTGNYDFTISTRNVGSVVGYAWIEFRAGDCTYAHIGGGSGTYAALPSTGKYLSGLEKLGGAGVNTFRPWRNGEVLPIISNTLANQGSDDDLYLGRQSSAYGGFLLHEFLAFGNKNLTTEETDKVMGYFAHKWGSTASLPSGHPYKSIAPYVF